MQNAPWVSEFSLLYQDDDLVIINKPAGILVHRSSISPDKWTCMNILRDQLDQWTYPVHRIDRKTSGVLIFALNPEMAGKLSLLFREKQVQKLYLAVVRGWVESGGRIDDALKTERSGKMQESASLYWGLNTVEMPWPVGPYQTARFSLVGVSPETGRWHQVRRHMQHLAHPLVGDTNHGEARQNRLFREKMGIHRLLLHAARIRFTHPVDGRIIDVRAPLDDEFLRVLRCFDWPHEERLFNWPKV